MNLIQTHDDLIINTDKIISINTNKSLEYIIINLADGISVRYKGSIDELMSALSITYTPKKVQE